MLTTDLCELCIEEKAQTALYHDRCSICSGLACAIHDYCEGCNRVICRHCDTEGGMPTTRFPGDRYPHPHNEIDDGGSGDFNWILAEDKLKHVHHTNFTQTETEESEL